MKKLILIGALIVGVIAVAAAQDIDKLFSNDKVREQLALNDKEINQLKDIWQGTEKDIQVAKADQDIKASELKRLLLEEKVNMNAVQKTLREAMDLEYTMRLLQIERVVKAKDILGDKRWADLERIMRMAKRRDMEKNGPGPGPDRPLHDGMPLKH
jgi:hypothetical protein